jgi:DNA-directed RNA polymerase subunit alpha
MTVKYGKFQMPEKIEIEQATRSNTFARVVAEPFERGFGHTIGNALRRVMLTSMEAPSIISVKIEGVAHEYSAIDGIVEDMTHIVLNFKGALLRFLPSKENESREPQIVTKILEVTQEMIDSNNGSYKATFNDVMGDSVFEVVNPDLHIFTITKPMTKRIDIKVACGRGYVPSERHEILNKVVDEIVLDSSFSPVTLVNYFVENTRVGQDTDYDRLILEIVTDGRIKPEEALTFAVQIAVKHFDVFNSIKTHAIEFEKAKLEKNKDKEDILQKLALRISEIELSVRSTNCLAGANIATIGELVVMPEYEMLRFRNFGKKSLTEIKQKLSEMGLSLGMDLSKYGINKDNIDSIINKFLEEQHKRNSES